MFRLLYDRDSLLVLVELDHAVAFRIIHVIAEHCSTMLHCDSLAQGTPQPVAIKDVITQHKRARLAVDELLTQQERLCQPVRARLDLVGESHAILASIAQQTLEIRQIMRCADNQDVANARHHQHAQRIVNHRLVIHRQQLLRRDRGQRIQAGTGTTGKDDALHNRPAF